MHTYRIYEVKLVNRKQEHIRLGTIKAINSDNAIRKAIIGTRKNINDMRAIAYV